VLADRGAWGIELLALLVALKMNYTDRVYLLRGNHEGSACTRFYGFKVIRGYGGCPPRPLPTAPGVPRLV